MSWQKSSGYNRRASVEALIGRYKRVIGDALRSRSDETEAIEIAIVAAALNGMVKFKRPSYTRIVLKGRMPRPQAAGRPLCNTVPKFATPQTGEAE
jgi:hypothetical protein